MTDARGHRAELLALEDEGGLGWPGPPSPEGGGLGWPGDVRGKAG